MLKPLGNTFKIRARRFIPATAELITGFSRPKRYKMSRRSVVELMRRTREFNEAKRKKKRHGERLNWHDAEFDIKGWVISPA